MLELLFNVALLGVDLLVLRFVRWRRSGAAVIGGAVVAAGFAVAGSIAAAIVKSDELSCPR